MDVPRLRLTPVLVNHHERRVHGLLRDSIEENGARLLAKVRLGDVFDVSGITGSLKTYALRAHFDFVVVDDAFLPLFAVEFDGQQHYNDPDAIRRDDTKNRLCEIADLPLLRVTSDYFTRAAQTTVLQYAVDAFFLSQGFFHAQEQGWVPSDEPFDPAMVIRRTPSGKLVFNALDSESRLDLLEHWKANHLPSYCPAEALMASKKEGSVTAASYMAVAEGRFLVTKVRLRDCRFQGIGPLEIASELATIGIADQAERWLAGEAVASGWGRMKALFEEIQASIDEGCLVALSGGPGLRGAGAIPNDIHLPRLSRNLAPAYETR